MNNDSVIAIIVSFNPDINVLATNVESLKKQVDKVIVVDNFSINNEELVAQLSREVEILSLDKNYGLAKAQNDGIREAKKWGLLMSSFLTKIVLLMTILLVSN